MRRVDAAIMSLGFALLLGALLLLFGLPCNKDWSSDIQKRRRRRPPPPESRRAQAP